MISDIQVFYYYGVVLTKLDAFNLTIKKDMTDLYELVFSHSLNYQYVGKASYSDRIIIGREVFWDYGKSLIEVRPFDNDLALETDNVDGVDNYSNLILDEHEKDEIKRRLLEMGITEQPKYYCIATYGKNQ